MSSEIVHHQQLPFTVSDKWLKKGREFGNDTRQFVERDFYVDDGLKSLPTTEAAIDFSVSSIIAQAWQADRPTRTPARPKKYFVYVKNNTKYPFIQKSTVFECKM